MEEACRDRKTPGKKTFLKLMKKQPEIIFYTSPQGDIKIEVFFQDETIWLTQKRMAEIFNVDVKTINEHLKNIFLTKELIENSVIRKFRIVQKEGSRFEETQ